MASPSAFPAPAPGPAPSLCNSSIIFTPASPGIRVGDFFCPLTPMSQLSTADPNAQLLHYIFEVNRERRASMRLTGSCQLPGHAGQGFTIEVHLEESKGSSTPSLFEFMKTAATDTVTALGEEMKTIGEKTTAAYYSSLSKMKKAFSEVEVSKSDQKGEGAADNDFLWSDIPNHPRSVLNRISISAGSTTHVIGYHFDMKPLAPVDYSLPALPPLMDISHKVFQDGEYTQLLFRAVCQLPYHAGVQLDLQLTLHGVAVVIEKDGEDVQVIPRVRRKGKGRMKISDKVKHIQQKICGEENE